MHIKKFSNLKYILLFNSLVSLLLFLWKQKPEGCKVTKTIKEICSMFNILMSFVQKYKCRYI